MRLRATGAVAALIAVAVGGCASKGSGGAATNPGGPLAAGSTASSTSASATGTTPPSTSPVAPTIVPDKSPPSSSGSAPTVPPSTGTCHAGQLAVALKALPGGQSGHTYYDIVLTNRSSNPCDVFGFATVAVLDPNHKPIAVPVEDFPGNRGETPGPPATVTLKPGGSAAETLVYSSDSNPPYRPAPAFLSVTVPGSTPVVLMFRNQPVSPADTMNLSAFIPGSSSPPF